MHWRYRILIMLVFFMLLPLPRIFASPLHPCDVIIDVGHGGIDGGTSNGDYIEKNINLNMGKKLYEDLSKMGYCVILNRTGDYALSEENHWLHSHSRHRRDLAQRKQLSHEINAKILISLHTNWSNSEKMFGPLVLYQKNKQEAGLLANGIQKYLNHYYKTTYKALPMRSFYLLKHAACPAVIVEMGYISNPEDLQRLITKKSQEEIAGNIAQAVHEYFMVYYRK